MELLGLPGFSVAALEDSVTRYRSGITLASAACAIVLRDSMGFPDASVHQLTLRSPWPWDPPRDLVSVSVVAREHAADVRFRNLAESRPPIERWRTARAILKEHPAAASAFGRVPFLRSEDPDVPPGAEQLRAVVEDFDTPGDWQLARRTMESDGNRNNRLLATLVLTNFPNRDSSYFLLADGLRFPADPATGLAARVLRGLAESFDHPVDWRQARATLDALLGGTNLFAFEDVLAALRHTDVEASLVRELVRENPHVFRAKLRSRFEFVRVPVVQFLEERTGASRGGDPEAWRRWLEDELTR